MFCKKHGITQSMSKAGCPYDNPYMERFYNTFKNCFYNRFTFENVGIIKELYILILMGSIVIITLLFNQFRELSGMEH
jgi:transposase InsO family protein